MGFALSEAAARRGAEVTLVSGPVTLSTPPQVRRIDVESAEEMLQACKQSFAKSHVFIATAAVGDYTPEESHSQKLKKSKRPLSIKLKPTIDILKTLSQTKKSGQIVVGFAAETQHVLDYARKKLQEKKLDLIVANDVSKPGVGFASDDNEVHCIDRKGKLKSSGRRSKTELAEFILDCLEGLIPSQLS